MRETGSAAMARGDWATLNSRSDASCVTSSRVCAESIVEMSTSKGFSLLLWAIFSTAGSSSPSIARASRLITAETGAAEVGMRLTKSSRRSHKDHQGHEGKNTKKHVERTPGVDAAAVVA